MGEREGVPRFLFGEANLVGEPDISSAGSPPVSGPEELRATEPIGDNRYQGVFPFPEPTSDTRGNLMLPLDSGYQVK